MSAIVGSLTEFAPEAVEAFVESMEGTENAIFDAMAAYLRRQIARNFVMLPQLTLYEFAIGELI